MTDQHAEPSVAGTHGAGTADQSSAAGLASRVKICGHTRTAEITASVAAGADAVGIIVDVPVDTPREVSVEQAATLLDAVPPFVTGVVVTMPETPEAVVGLVERLGPDAVQLHSALPRGDVAYLRAAIETRLLVTVPADNRQLATAYDGLADALLVDTVDAEGSGGTGRTHDWERTREIAATVDSPVIVAGGLDPSNVGEAIETIGPYGVDVASGIEGDTPSERATGRHDSTAVAAFVRAAKGAQPGVTRS
jgi:phosphoribosylanthranilate isomerase